MEGRGNARRVETSPTAHACVVRRLPRRGPPSYDGGYECAATYIMLILM